MVDGIVWRIYMMITKETKPFDWFSFWVFVALQVVTILVVVIPLWRSARRSRKIETWQKSILQFITDGLQLLSTQWDTDADAWNTSVDEFSQKVVAFLQKDSPKAVPIFISNIGMPTNVVLGLPLGTQGSSNLLSHRITNLQSIMESPEVYFG